MSGKIIGIGIGRIADFAQRLNHFKRDSIDFTVAAQLVIQFPGGSTVIQSHAIDLAVHIIGRFGKEWGLLKFYLDDAIMLYRFFGFAHQLLSQFIGLPLANTANGDRWPSSFFS